MATLKIAYDNVFGLSDTVITEDMTEATGYPLTRLYDNYRTLLYKEGSADTRYIKADLTGHSTVPTVGFIGYELSDTNVKIEHSDNDAAWTTAYNDSETSYYEWLATPLQKNYWMFTFTATPQCAEALCHSVLSFDIKASPTPTMGDESTVIWQKTMGGTERAVKLGDVKRTRTYTIRSTHTAIEALQTAVRSNYHKPVYIYDHNAETYPVRFMSPITITYQGPDVAESTLTMREI